MGCVRLLVNSCSFERSTKHYEPMLRMSQVVFSINKYNTTKRAIVLGARLLQFEYEYGAANNQGNFRVSEELSSVNGLPRNPIHLMRMPKIMMG